MRRAETLQSMTLETVVATWGRWKTKRRGLGRDASLMQSGDFL